MLGTALPFLSLLLAHTLGRSHLDLEIQDDGASAVLTVDPDDLRPDLREPLDSDRSGNIDATESRSASLFLTGVLGRFVTITRENKSCTARFTEPLAPAGDVVRAWMRFACTGARPPEVRFSGASLVSAAHVLWLTVRQGTTTTTVQLTRAAPLWPQRQTGFVVALMLGISHILEGTDHLLFLAVLLLGTSGWRRRVFAVTAFTLGHSVTLVAVALGAVAPQSRWAEAAIALTILLTAGHVFWRRESSSWWRPRVGPPSGFDRFAPRLAAQRGVAPPPNTQRYSSSSRLALHHNPSPGTNQNHWADPLAASAIGLVHGLGFGAFLIEGRGTGANVISELLGFNTGVEAGQLLFVVPLAWAVSGSAGHPARIGKSVMALTFGAIFFETQPILTVWLGALVLALWAAWKLQRTDLVPRCCSAVAALAALEMLWERVG